MYINKQIKHYTKLAIMTNTQLRIIKKKNAVKKKHHTTQPAQNKHAMAYEIRSKNQKLDSFFYV